MKIETPRGQLIKYDSGQVRLYWNKDFKLKWERKYSKAQIFIDNEVLKLNARYIPFQSGFLNRSGVLGTIPGSGEVIYNAPYARYMYYGKIMRDASGRAFFGGAPKHVTDEDLTYHGSPERGKLWFERMKQNHNVQLLRGAANFMK